MNTPELMAALAGALRHRLWAASTEYSTVSEVPLYSVYTLWEKLGRPRNIQILGVGYCIVEGAGQELALRVWDEGNTEEAQNQLRRVYKTLEDV